jgi:hypothetical protein
VSWILHDLLIFWSPGTRMNDLVWLTNDFHHASDTDWIRIQVGLGLQSRSEIQTGSGFNEYRYGSMITLISITTGEYRVAKKYWYRNRNHVGYEGDMYLVLGGYVQLYRTRVLTVILDWWMRIRVCTGTIWSCVADPGCLSRISDPGSKKSNKRQGGKN